MRRPPRLHLLLEGQTEEAIANALLLPHFKDRGWEVSQSIVTTKRPASGGKFRLFRISCSTKPKPGCSRRRKRWGY